MIVRTEHGRVLADAEAIAVMLGRALPTVRKHCTAVATDLGTGRLLYDQTDAQTTLGKVKQRRSTRRVKRS